MMAMRCWRCVVLCATFMGACAAVTAGSTYYPPPESEGGWRKNTDPTFVESLGLDPKALNAFGEWYTTGKGSAGLHDQSALVIKNGWVVGEWGHPTDVIRLASNGKAIGEALFGQMLLRRGTMGIPFDLSIDSHLYDERWLPQGYPLSDPRKAEISFRELFRHTTGIQPEDAQNNDRGGERDEVRYIVGRDPVLKESQHLYFDPGHPEQYDLRYSSVAFKHLPILIETMTGPVPPPLTASINETAGNTFLRKQLLDPIGILRPQKCWEGCGEPYLIPRDYARLGYFFLRDGVWNGTALVPEGYIPFFRETSSYPNIYGNTKKKANDYAGSWPPTYNFFGEYPGEKYPEDMFFIGGSGFQVCAMIPSLDLLALKGGPSKSQGNSSTFLELLFAAVKS